ncbi:MAG: RepB family plasmid replication initiator protein [Clostridium sp.]|nr:RepB family plasmid replication initiator protein [Clostridium sp.]
MDEIIKYHNDMNKVNFSGFNEKELNIFFSLILLAKDKGTNELSIPFSELRKLSNDDGKNRDRFIKSMVNTHSKLIQLFYKIETESSITMFTLFNRFEINLNENILNVKINKDFAFLLNDLVANFTKFDLIEFTSLKSTYSKNLFKVLKQWENKKEKEFSLDEFKALLGITGKYEKMSALDTYVLGQLRKELPEFFPNLKIEKKKTGRAVTSLKFTWGQKHQDINYTDDVEIEISEELQKAFEKASHNRFIQPFLTEDNKAELIDFFEDEKILIKGLIYAYKKIDKEFKRLSYLIKTITTGAEQHTKTIKVVKKEKKNSLNEDDYRQTSFDEIVPQPKVEEKQREIKEIYEDDFEKLYKEYLKNNNADDTPYAKKCFAMPYKIIKREVKKVYTIEDIPEEKLIGKNGKKLVGGALKMRAKKILDEMNK